MNVLLLFLIPLLSGLLSFLIRKDNVVRILCLLSSVITVVIAITSVRTFNAQPGAAGLRFHAPWMGSLGSSFSLHLDGLSLILCLLTAVAYPLILLSTWWTDYRKPNNFFALMMLTQAGLMGVFTATDALLFYFFWELALVPVYFLCSGWGGERRIAVTFKFFIYTFTASVLMLVGLLYLYFQTPDHSFALSSFYHLKLSGPQQTMVFWMLFVAFAVKMPVFPFHTWQPDTYEQSPTAVTMVLSGLMVKMGVYGVIRWVLPIVPLASYSWGDVVMSLAVAGIIYASIIAIRQDDIKRLIAYSSIAHVGLMAATAFAETKTGYQGLMIQMFNHGINIIGLWIVIELIERQLGTRKLSQLGGLAQKAPALATLLVILAFANISLPLTNSFIGEFLMFNGIWSSGFTQYNIVFTVLAALSIILSAVYTLTMVQKIFYGQTNQLTETAVDIRTNEKVSLGVIVILIFVLGVYPQPLLNLTDGFVDGLLREIKVTNLLLK
ncbi:MAG TPA: NADH-quinone oxidoreductase subunit M [Flavisolibacter sp.]|nr:NADH-quinone oxidoreductase subunit M [Flavisolibacter sp.]